MRFSAPAELGMGAVRTAGRSKRIDTKVSILLGLQFPLFHSLAKIRERRPLRKGERQSGYRYVCFVKYSQFTDSVLLHRTESLSRRDITVSRNSLVGDYRQHLRIMRSIPFIFAGAVCNNALTNCAALSCRTLRRVARMCSSMVSDTANMRIHGAQSASRREEKSSAVPLFGAIAGLRSAPD